MSETPSRETSQWQVAHAALARLSRQRAGLDFEEGECLLSAKRASVHTRLGYGSFFEYIERLFGYSPRVTHDKLRVAEALEGLPESRSRCATGRRHGRASVSSRAWRRAKRSKRGSTPLAGARCTKWNGWCPVVAPVTCRAPRKCLPPSGMFCVLMCRETCSRPFAMRLPSCGATRLARSMMTQHSC